VLGRCVGLAAVALTAIVTVACGPMLVRPGTTPRPTPSPSPTFTLDETGFEGVVVDEAGEPIAGVRIQLRVGPRTWAAETTAEGTFFDRGNLGDIAIKASKDGYVTVETTVTVVPNEIAEIEIVLVADG